MGSQLDKVAARILEALEDRGALTLDEVVEALARERQGGRLRSRRDLQRKVAQKLREGGALTEGGLAGRDHEGRFIITDKGREVARAKKQTLTIVETPEPKALKKPSKVRWLGGRIKAMFGAMLAAWKAVWRVMPGRVRRGFVFAVIALVTAAAILVYREFHTSALQAHYFARVASMLTFKVGEGPSDAIVFPEHGPYDRALGYSLLPGLLERLSKKGFTIEAQARLSPRHLQMAKGGIYPLYREKAQAGLTVLDADGKALFTSFYPQLIYERFEDIPDVIVDTLLFIENRDLLDGKYPFKNPTLEWSRLGRAALDLAVSKVLPDHDVPGGSTLATQIEKYRHSPEGRTSTVGEKLRQMRSATYRSYLDGPNTMEARRRIVTNYINSVPLGAIPGAGEVRGVGHGLVAWHGANFSEVNKLLADVNSPVADVGTLKNKARAYKEVLSLFLAQRRPAYYLQQDREALKDLVDKHLGILVKGGIITPTFRDAVAKAELTFRNNVIMFQPERLNFVERKGANAVRVHLLSLFGFDRLYTLDRLDLKVTSTIDYGTQREVTSLLGQLKDPAFAKANGLMDQRLLAQGDPADVIYSFTLRERVGNVNVLRVQADNVDGPFNVSEGGKLELGSTAKLRTLTHYLEIVEMLFQDLGRIKREELAKLEFHPQDRLSAWARDWLLQQETPTRAAILDAAMERTYSANPGEAFFTGSGQHRFSNFDKNDNGRVVTVRESLRKSINLPFVRMMRDLVYYHVGRIPHAKGMLEDATNPERRAYLTRFANKEGREFLGRFYLRYRGLSSAEVYETLLKKSRLTLRRLAAIDAVVRPEATFEEFAAFATGRLAGIQPNAKIVRHVYNEMRRPELTLHDKGYIASVHPLELWLVSHMHRVPHANFSEIMQQSAEERQEAYQWLFNSKAKTKQDRRIKIMLEQEAFERVHAAWRRLGYPFGSLVPTYATALGSSGDKPAALADLLGIIASGGIRYTNIRVSRMHFAADTPFETQLKAQFEPGTRVLSEDVAARLRDALRAVVDDGTAVRIKGAFTLGDGSVLPIGGKTGTGDNRYSIFAPGGRIIESKAMSRTATFAFYIGDRFFGTLTAYVPSVEAGSYTFTSALPVQILKILSPKLTPLLTRPGTL